MPLRESKGPALKPTGPLDKMSFSIGIYCQAVSHDDTLKDSTHNSSSVMAASHWHGQHPEHKYHGLAEMDSHALPYGTHSVKKVNQVSVVKAAAPLLCIFWSQCRSRGAFHVLSKKKSRAEKCWWHIPQSPSHWGNQVHSFEWQKHATLRSYLITKEERQHALAQCTPSSLCKAWYTYSSSTAVLGPIPLPGILKVSTRTATHHIIGAIWTRTPPEVWFEFFHPGLKGGPEVELIQTQVTWMAEYPTTYKPH